MIAMVGSLGLLVGFLIGFAARDAIDLIRHPRKETPMPGSSQRTRRVLYVGLAISLILNVATGILVGVTLTSTNAYSRCSAEWQQDFSVAYKARVSARASVDNALDKVVTAVALEDPRLFRRAVARYIRLRDQQIKKQERNPLPALPQTTCGKR